MLITNQPISSPSRLKFLLLLFSLNLGLYLLLIPTTQTTSYLFNSPVEFFFKTFLIAVLTTGTFLLSLGLSTSLAGSFLAWLVITFNLPLIQIPGRLSPLLIGSGVAWGLCLLWHLPDLKNLKIFGRLNQVGMESWAILFALTLILLGLIFKSFVPNPVFHPIPFLEGLFGLLLDKQLGLFSYAPLYLLTFSGLGMLLREGLSKKFLILVAGLLIYGIICLIQYGFPVKPHSPELIRPPHPEDIIPLLPVLGSLIAVFLGWTRILLFPYFPILPFLLLTNIGIVGSVLLKYPDIPSLIGKFRNFQVDLTENLGREVLFFYPNLASEPSWLSWGTWFLVFGALVFLGYHAASYRSSFTHRPLLVAGGNRQQTINHGQRTTGSIIKSLVFVSIVFLVAVLLFQLAPRRYVVPVEYPLYLSLAKPTREIELEEDLAPSSKSFILVSSLINSIGFPHGKAAMILTMTGDGGEEQSFSILAGKHTSEWAFENPDVQRFLAHGQAMIYNSWVTRIRRRPKFEAHHYYAQFDFKDPMKIKKIDLSFTLPPGFKLPGGMLRVEKLILLY